MASQRATVQAYARPRVKDPLSDPLIAMQRDRREKELKNEHNSREMSAVSGAMLHRIHDVKRLQQEIKELEEGVLDYQAQIDLLNERKTDLQRSLVKHREWCATFDRMIGESAHPRRYPPAVG